MTTTVCNEASRRPDLPAESACPDRDAIDRLRTALNSVLLGKSELIELVLACVLARGHLLFDDLPGLGKTTLAKALARAVGGKFARVQCTADLLPTDITGFNLFNQRSREFEFLPGPVFADVVLVDEINRATPRTQSALFEAMAERQVTIDNHCRRLPASFFVIATQNPLDSHGAFPLPEAQLDRFTMKLKIGYPDKEFELRMLSEDVAGRVEPDARPPVLAPEQLQALQAHVARIEVAENVQEYLVDLTRASRSHPAVRLGISPRGMLTWQRVAQARAHLQGRDFTTPDDVQDVALAVLEVRLAGDFDSPRRTIEEILESVPVPARRRATKET